MLQLLVSVSLDALEQRSESQLLLVSQLGFFLLDNGLHLSLQLVSFELLEEIRLHFDFFGLFVALHAHQFRLLVSQLQQVF